MYHPFADRTSNERTMLANERTLLAYIRTMLTFFIAGVTFIQFFDNLVMEVVGWVFIPVSLVFLAVGLWSFLSMKTSLRRCSDAQKPES